MTRMLHQARPLTLPPGDIYEPMPIPADIEATREAKRLRRAIRSAMSRIDRLIASNCADVELEIAIIRDELEQALRSGGDDEPAKIGP